VDWREVWMQSGNGLEDCHGVSFWRATGLPKTPLSATSRRRKSESVDVRRDGLFGVRPGSGIPSNHPLRLIRGVADEPLKTLDAQFSALYFDNGRRSIPPEQLQRALLLQAIYTIRSEQLLMEQLNYNLLFRWFVGL